MKYRTFVLASVLLLLASALQAQSFFHPGILHSREDLLRMKQGVATRSEPIYAGYQVFVKNPASSFDYKIQGPFETVGRNPTTGQAEYDNDANAAHQNAIMWVITGDKRYAEKAIAIVNAWSSTLRFITGRDAVLMAGLGPFKMVNAAEILRYTNAGWKQADIVLAEKHFREVVYPVIKNFAPFANGNWEAAAMKTIMAIGVFCNERSMFDDVLKYYTFGSGNGSLLNYVINEDGQIQESGRDQPHSQLGIAMLAECCAIAWNQGLDLYSYANNRLLKGFEYTARYNLGYDDLPFQEWLDRTGKYHHYKISNTGRGALRAIYEQVYNHYVKRMGLSAPFVQQAAEKLRPEGPGNPGADHPGYGTFYFTSNNPGSGKNTAPAPPGGISGKATNKKVIINWVPSIRAKEYIIKRSTKGAGPYTLIGRAVKTIGFTDTSVKAGTVYHYRIVAVNKKGNSSDSHMFSISAGLPFPWKQTELSDAVNGSSSFNGTRFTVESDGAGVDSNAEKAHLTYQPLEGDGEFTIRYIPQLSSQFSQVSLSFRNDTSAASSAVLLLLSAAKTNQIEAPSWHLTLLRKNKSGQPTAVFTGPALSEPSVTFGRLTGYLWMRLKRQGNSFTAFSSLNGKDWLPAGTATLDLATPALVGFSVASGMPNSTVVSFDGVVVR